MTSDWVEPFCGACFEINLGGSTGEFHAGIMEQRDATRKIKNFPTLAVFALGGRQCDPDPFVGCDVPFGVFKANGVRTGGILNGLICGQKLGLCIFVGSGETGIDHAQGFGFVLLEQGKANFKSTAAFLPL